MRTRALTIKYVCNWKHILRKREKEREMGREGERQEIENLF